jgi:hypothetical protein
MVDQLAQGRTLTAGQRAKLREIDGELRTADAAWTTRVTSAPSELEAYVLRRWTEARRRNGLGASDPDPRVAAEVARIAARASEAAQADAKGWKPSPTEAVAAWINRYLREGGRGSAEDRDWPFKWLPGRCRDYPLPKRSEVQRQPRADQAGSPAERTVAPSAPADPPSPDVAVAEINNLLSNIGTASFDGPSLRPTRPGAAVLRLVTGGGE